MPTEEGTGVLWVLTGTHPYDDPPRQDGEPSQPARACMFACAVVVVVVTDCGSKACVSHKKKKQDWKKIRTVTFIL